MTTPPDALPLVSAVIPTHNRARMLERALESMVRQTYPNLEIIVVDDGSSDDTARVVDRFRAKAPVVYLRNETPLGAPAARNRGISEAKGAFVAGLDDDDEWMPDRIEKLVAAVDPSVACVTSDDLLVSTRGAVRWRKPRLITLDDLLLSNAVGNQVLVSRERLLDVGGFDETLPAAQDYDLWIRLAERFGPIRNVRKPLQRIHMGHADRITTSSSQYRGYMAVYARHRHLMSKTQRAYQLYSIGRKVGRATSLRRFLRMVPPKRWIKEMKGEILRRLQGMQERSRRSGR